MQKPWMIYGLVMQQFGWWCNHLGGDATTLDGDATTWVVTQPLGWLRHHTQKRPLKIQRSEKGCDILYVKNFMRAGKWYHAISEIVLELITNMWSSAWRQLTYSSILRTLKGSEIFEIFVFFRSFSWNSIFHILVYTWPSRKWFAKWFGWYTAHIYRGWVLPL